MMLTALYEYAQRQGLLANTDYEERRIDLVVDLSLKGQVLSVTETDKKTMRVPRFAHSVAVAAAFAADNAKYALGIGAPDLNREARARVAECHAAFAELMIAVANEFEGDVALRALAQFLKASDSHRAKVLADRAADKWTGSENVVFRVNDQFVHESPGAQAYWERQRKMGNARRAAVRCLVTGEFAPLALTHPPILHVPGASQPRTALVSFNNAAFTSMGLKQAENAPVSRQAAEGYVAALNELLSKDPSKGRRYRSGIGLGNDNVVLIWTRDPTSELNSLLDLLDPRDKEVGLAVIDGPLRGIEPSKSDATDFYAVTIGGNAARVVVRDWYQSRFGVVKKAVLQWFEDLRLPGQQRPSALWQLLGSIDPPGNASIPPSLASALARSALFGGRAPVEVLRHALMRLRVPPKEKEQHLLRQRVALIKLTLIRTFNQEITVALDEEKKDVPYLLGRLFAVLERLQGAALGDVNATIRDRYFGAASSTPAIVFPRLIRLSQHHASKSGAGWLEGIKGQIFSRLPPEQFPQILSLEDQGLFAVGYYQQREKFFEKRDTTTPKKEQA